MCSRYPVIPCDALLHLKLNVAIPPNLPIFLPQRLRTRQWGTEAGPLGPHGVIAQPAVEGDIDFARGVVIIHHHRGDWNARAVGLTTRSVTRPPVLRVRSCHLGPAGSICLMVSSVPSIWLLCSHVKWNSSLAYVRDIRIKNTSI